MSPAGAAPPPHKSFEYICIFREPRARLVRYIYESIGSRAEENRKCGFPSLSPEPGYSRAGKKTLTARVYIEPDIKSGEAC